MKLSFSRARVGFLVFVGVLTAVVGLFLVGQRSQLFTSTFIVHANFTSAEGVKPGTFVVMAGYNIGAVTDIELTQKADSVCVTMRVNEDVHRFIKPDSKAVIKQEGLVGNKYINLLIGSEGFPIVANDGYIQGEPPFALGAMADNVQAITDSVLQLSGHLNKLLSGLASGKGSIGRLLTDPQLYDGLLELTSETEEGLRKTTDQLARLTTMLSTSGKNIDCLVIHTDSMVGNATNVAHELNTLVHNLNSGRGSLGALLTDRQLYDSLTSLVTALTDVSNDASNAANQISQGVYAMRDHWLLGKVLGGPNFDNEKPPMPAYQKRLKELQKRSIELDEREKSIRAKERELGLRPGEGGK
jgi:phospholipid/cholesterol/gamma-HCH transport system substrate-binding protein